ncbi:hypothetical protein Pint_33606 [Pistacia integerrima]|uniref:Uncharacterized protein n=1 Tax=Pistacia integerrima TaxID=434235 RepID=A0ACC0X473_9ROSI|nr:hypothetical protein Pint_33606 [Pistacia integerrima]
MAKKPCMGRQKIAISKIPKKNNLQVTFSKRRAGVFKKASELSTLCGVEIAIIVFSPANKVFSFGHPNVDSIVDRFLARNPPSNSDVQYQLIEAHRNANIRELNVQLTQVLNQQEVEKKRGEFLNDTRKASRKFCWWEAPIDELELHQLEQLRTAMEELKKNVANEANRILVESNNPSPFDAVNNYNIEHDCKPKDISVTSSSLPAWKWP